MIPKPNITGLHFVSLYFPDVQSAREFYTKAIGEPAFSDSETSTYGWDLQSSWLTFLPASAGTKPSALPRNTEFGLCVATPEDVDLLVQRFVLAGAREHMKPHDTTMYIPMRFACVDDPFGVRIDIYCPL